MKTVNVVAAVIRENTRVLATQRGYGEYKDWWEFPGGKIEPGETPEQALAREIREELEVEITVGDFIASIEYDYPAFHLKMRVYWAAIRKGSLIMKEHEAMQWLSANDLDTVSWLPADRLALEAVKEGLRTRHAAEARDLHF